MGLYVGLSWANLKSHVDELAPPVFERVLKTGGEGFYVTVVGYDDEAGAHIIRVFQHLDPLSNHDISKVEPWDLDDLADDYYFGIMFIENPGPKGNPDGASAVSFMEGDADADE